MCYVETPSIVVANEGTVLSSADSTTATATAIASTTALSTSSINRSFSEEEMAAKRSQVIMMEQEISLAHKAMESKGFNTSTFLNNISSLITSKGQKKEVLFELIKNWHTFARALNDKINGLILAKQEYLIIKVHRQVQKLESEMDFHGVKYLDRYFGINYNIFKLKQLYETWKENHDVLAGNPKAFAKKKYAFEEYFQTVLQLEADIPGVQRLKISKPSSSSNKGSSDDSGSGSSIGTLSVNILSVMEKSLKFINHLFWRGTVKSDASLTTSIDELFKSLQQYNGNKVSIEGREHLPNKQLPAEDDKIVNLIVPSHRHGLEDGMIMSNLALSDYIVFVNTSTISSWRPFTSLLGDQPELVAVGPIRGSNQIRPTEKILQSLSKGVSRNIINYPEGFVSTLGEVLPVNQSFDIKLITSLQENGYKVKIIPVAHEVPSSFLVTGHFVEGKNISAKVLPPIVPEVVKYIIELENAQERPLSQLLSTLLRFIWIENIQNNKEIGLKDLEQRIDEKLPELMLGKDQERVDNYLDAIANDTPWAYGCDG